MKVKKIILSLFCISIFCSGLNAAFTKPFTTSGQANLKDSVSAMPTGANLRFYTTPTKPYPTNKWFSSVYVKDYTNAMMTTYPLSLSYTTSAKGYSLSANDVSVVVSDKVELRRSVDSRGLVVGATPFTMASSAVSLKAYSDWAVTAVAQDTSDSTKRITTTFGKGFLFVYNSFTGNINPKLYNVDQVMKSNGTGQLNNDVYVDDDKVLVIVMNGSKRESYGIFAPPNTRFTKKADGLEITFANATDEAQRYLSIVLISTNDVVSSADSVNKMNNNYYKYAYNFVTDTKATYVVNANMEVETTFTFTFEQKRSGGSFVANQTIFALFPHQWRNLSQGVTETEIFKTIRGTMKTMKGNIFKTKMQFNGVLPVLSYEANDTASRNKLQGYINTDKNYTWPSAADTYYRGKYIAKVSNLIPIFHQFGDFISKNSMLEYLRTELITWYGNSNSRYFGYDNTWGGIIGSPNDFGYNAYNDHHFHHGYFIYASALFSMYDTETTLNKRMDFATGYKAMVDALAQDIANTDRASASFPYMRSFDVYSGHSWANGKGQGSYVGNDQESSSEAMNSWAGIILWGVATNNQTLIDAGIYGYTTEYEAVKEYYFDTSGENYADFRSPTGAFQYNSFGILYESGFVWGLYWWYAGQQLNREIKGIQVLPLTPSMLYLGYDIAYAKKFYAEVSAGTRWKSILLRFKSLFDAPAAKTEFEAGGFYDSTGVDDGDSLTYSYHFINFFNAYGHVNTEYYADIPTFTVMKSTSGEYTYIAYNNDTSAKAVTFRKRSNNAVAGTMTIPAKNIASTKDFVKIKYDSLSGYKFSHQASDWSLVIAGEVADFNGTTPNITITEKVNPAQQSGYMYIGNTCFEVQSTSSTIKTTIPMVFEINTAIVPSDVNITNLRLAYINAGSIEVINVIPDASSKIITTISQNKTGQYILVLPTDYIFTGSGSGWNTTISGSSTAFSSAPNITITAVAVPPVDSKYNYVNNISFKIENTGGNILSSIPMIFDFSSAVLPIGVNANDLRLAFVNTITGAIEEIAAIPSLGRKITTAVTNLMIGQYVLVQPLSNPKNLKVFAFPSPYRPSKHGNTGITFNNVKIGTQIKIYNISGEKVFDIRVDSVDINNNYKWNVTNNSGKDISSGLYIYYIESDGKIIKGKFVIER